MNVQNSRRELMERMLRGELAPARAVPEKISPRDPARTVPLTLEQSQLWLHAALAPDMPLYNESITIHRLGAYDHAALERALTEVVRRHEIWRTAFIERDGELIQQVADPMPIALPLIDISGLPEQVRDREAVRLATEDARAPIPLDQAPLFRARVVRLSDTEHRLYLTLHHIIFDGVSIYRTLVPELAKLVAAFERGGNSPLAEPALQYADYAAWQADQRDEAAEARQIEYWRGALAGEIPRLEVAGDRPLPARPTHAGSMECFDLAAPLIERLRDLARDEGATLYMVLLAAYKAMLFRYTGDTDIIVGGATDTRRRPELQPLMGYFLNTLALRSHPRGELSFRRYLAEVKGSVIGALGASDIPFNKLLRALDIKRGGGTHPLFNTLFSIEPPVEPFPEGWDLTQMDVVVGAAKYDIYLELDERQEDKGGGMVGRFLYSTELFDPSTMRRMIGHWTTLLEGVVADPDTQLSALPMLGRDERTVLVEGWNQTARELPHETVVDWYAAMLAANGSEAAIEQGGQRWTYAELDRRADAIAARLVADGVEPGALVGLSLTRTPWMVAAMLGVARAGAAYLPLDPAFPPARLAMIVEDAQPALILVEPDTAEVLSDCAAPLVELARNWPDATKPDRAVRGDDLAYVLYTSGSTGRPKGVEINHRSLANLLLAMQEAPGFAAGESLLAVTTLSFDIAELELWLPLVSGGKVILATREQATDMVALADLIGAAKPDMLQATPATWRGLIEAGWYGARKLRALCGGEALPGSLADELMPRVKELWNVYGPTETTIWSTVSRVEAGMPVTIGKPIANTTVRILDEQGNDRPIGAIGELHIGGMGLARGYRGRPDLTADKFVEVNGERLYKTGDLARWRSDGVLLCLGRTDHEEKIRGFRVAIEEIESALARLPDVAAAAVKAWPDASGERALAAYVVGKGDAASWRSALAQSLPDYMIPTRFVVLDALPMTPNGKIDRKALPEPTGAGDAAQPLDPPATPDEQRLAAIWMQVLQVESISRQDDFFSLGGHSLLVARLIRLIETEFGIRLAMATLLRTPRFADMASLVEASLTKVQAPVRHDRTAAAVSLPDRHRALSDQLIARNPALGELIAARPLDQFDHLLNDATGGQGYHLAPSVRSFFLSLPQEAREDYVRAYLLRLIGTFERRFDQSGLPDVFRDQYLEFFVRIIEEMEWGTFVADLTRDLVEKDLLVARLEMIPAGSSLIFPRGGFSRRNALTWGPTAWKQILRCGGHQPFLEPHMHDPMIATHLYPEKVEETYWLAAILLRENPAILGLFSATWLLDPALEEISPQLAYIRKVPLARGGGLFRIGKDMASVDLAISTCPHRRAAYEAGSYRPALYGLIWPRADLLKHYG